MPVNAIGQWIDEDASEKPETSVLNNTRPLQFGRGRPRLWQAQAVVEEDITLADGIMEEFGPSSAAEEVRHHTRTFIAINHELMARSGPAVVLKALIGQWTRCKLSSGTQVTYLSYVRPLFKSCWDAFARWKRTLDARHADDELRVQHQDLNDDELASRVKATENLSPRIHALTTLLHDTGARCRDLSRLRRKQIHVLRNNIGKFIGWRIQFRLMKHRRKRMLRITITFDQKVLKHPPSESCLAFLEDPAADPLERPFESFNCKNSAAKYSESVRSVGSSCGVKAHRRAFVNRLIRRFRRKYDEIMKYTAHFKASTIEAFYARNMSD
jgi:integrase